MKADQYIDILRHELRLSNHALVDANQRTMEANLQFDKRTDQLQSLQEQIETLQDANRNLGRLLDEETQRNMQASKTIADLVEKSKRRR